MCGICFCFFGVKIENNQFCFNPYSNYINNPYFWDKKELKDKHFGENFDFIKYIISKKQYIQDFGCQQIRQSIQNRGPDGFNALLIRKDALNNKYQFQMINDENEYQNLFAQQENLENDAFRLLLANSLLHLRGEKCNPNFQPIFANDCAFIYNGEIYQQQNQNKSNQLNEQSSQQEEYKQQQQQNEQINTDINYNQDKLINYSFNFDIYKNDTVQLFKIIQDFCQIFQKEFDFQEQPQNTQIYQQQYQRYQDHFSNIVNQFVGDFSFIFFDGKNHKIIVSKDVFGKRSLLLGFKENGFAIGSVAVNVNEEKLILSTVQEDEEGDEDLGKQKQQQQSQQSNQSKKEEEKEKFLEIKYLQDYFVAKEREWLELPNNNIIFIDIISNNKCPDQQKEIKLIWQSKELNSTLFNNSISEIKENSQPNLNIPEQIINSVTKDLKKSVKRVIKSIIELKHYFIQQQQYNKNQKLNKIENSQNQQQLQQINQQEVNLKSCNIQQQGEEQINLNQQQSQNVKTNSKISVLFSGGLDSTLLTRLIDQLLPNNEHIDLLNVSFSKDSHDRKTAISAYQELQNLNPNRIFNLILIDKTLSDVEKIEKQILKLIYPKITHMDFNIAAVLHFATKGIGYLYNQESFQDLEKQSSNILQTGAKVVISGLGADEIFGGYSRYRVAFQRNGYKELLQEQKFDLNRLWIRNLGRDDRAISENGVEARFPFLDQKLIQSINQIDYQYFTNFNLPRGTGDKVLLRAVALQLGLKLASSYKKRAIQFGTGIAKQSNIKNFGSNRKAKGTYIYSLKNKE